jgi:hypothetical protein
MRSCSEFNATVAKRLNRGITMDELMPEFNVAAMTPSFEVYEDYDSRVLPTIEIDDIFGKNEYDQGD